MPSRSSPSTGRFAGRTRKRKFRPAVSAQTIRSLCRIFRHLGDELRLQILWALSQENLFEVTELARVLDIRPPVLRHHLRLLRSAGLVGFQRRGKAVLYHFEAGFVSNLLEQLLTDFRCADRQFRFRDFALVYRRTAQSASS